MKVEYRALVSYPNPESVSHGPAVKTVEEAMGFVPERAEESGAFVAGVQVRQVDPWSDVPLQTIIQKLKEKM